MDIREAWERLLMIRELRFEAQSRSATTTGWNGVGMGTVRAEQVDVATMLFHEKGSWAHEGGREMAFSNVFRWTNDPEGRFLRIEHLRFGPAEPVYLFDLVPWSEHVLASTEPHVCREDLYSARMQFDRDAVHLNWTIVGPKKDESIRYWYK